MTLTVATPTVPGDSGLLIPRWTSFLGQNAARMAQVLNLPSAKTTAITTTNDTGQAIDLTDQLFQFLASRLYRINLRYWAQTENDRWYFERTYLLLGGTTPVLINSQSEIRNAFGIINSTVVQYGLCHAACNFDSSDTSITTTVGTSDVATSSTAGSSIGNISTNTATLTHPVARDGAKRVLGCNASADVATATEQLYATVFPVNTTTMSIFTADTATPTADGFDDDGRLEVSFYIEPPPNCFVTMNSNNVEVHVLGISSDEVLHTVEVFIDEGQDVPFQGS